MDAGLFGGTFNPLHNGHLGIIDFVMQRCKLSRIYLYPAAVPPHKSRQNLAPADDRLAMVKQSIKEKSGLFASDIELRRKGPSFTIDTIEAFQSVHGNHIQFHLIMGSDAFFDISTWKEKDKIFRAVPLIVMLRGMPPAPGQVASFIDEHIAKGYKTKEENFFFHEELKPVRILEVPRIDISSTMIRQRVRQGDDITGLVPQAVETIIRTKDLYK